MNITSQNKAFNNRRRLSVIGFDYGTHSTKVVQRYWGESQGKIVQFDDAVPGYPSQASPSVIREQDGRLYFGAKGVGMPNAMDYGSLKAELMDDLSDDPELAQKIEVLVVAYIAWALTEMFDRHPSWRHDRIQLQISAPTSFVGDADLEQKYDRIGHAAYALAIDGCGEIRQGIRYEDARLLIHPFLEMTPPPRQERRFSIQPETIAPIISLQQEPIVSSGMYLMIDMGAGTTEMSIVAVPRNSTEPIRCYYDSTERRGGSNLAELEDLPVGESQRRLEAFLRDFNKQASKVWQVGFMKDASNRIARRNWQQLTVLLTGGATRHTSITAKFDSDSKVPFSWQLHGTNHRTARHTPRTIQPSTASDGDDLSVFAVANGLSIHTSAWRQCFVMDAINQLTPITQSIPLMQSYLEIV